MEPGRRRSSVPCGKRGGAGHPPGGRSGCWAGRTSCTCARGPDAPGAGTGGSGGAGAAAAEPPPRCGRRFWCRWTGWRPIRRRCTGIPLLPVGAEQFPMPGCRRRRTTGGHRGRRRYRCMMGCPTPVGAHRPHHPSCGAAGHPGGNRKSGGGAAASPPDFCFDCQNIAPALPNGESGLSLLFSSPPEEGRHHGTWTGVGADDAADAHGLQRLRAVFPQRGAVGHILFAAGRR